MNPGIWKKVWGFLTQLLNTFHKGTSHAGTKPAEWYLDLLTECLEQTQQTISGNDFPPVEFNHKQRRQFAKIPGMAVNISTGVKLYHSQCEYLMEKLATAVFISRETYLKTPAQQSRNHEILKLLCRLATNVQSFVHGCCEDGGMQVALTAASVPVYVCSLGFYLEACTGLLRHSNNLGVALPTQTELDFLREAEMHEVERRDLLDQATLVDTINSVILHGESSSTSCQLQLATIVQKRLEASQAASTSGSSQSSYLEAWQVDGKSILRLEELGTGTAAKVYKAKWFGAIDVAEKVFGVSRNASFDQEISLLAKLSHPNIVSFVGYWTDEHSCSIVSELMDGDLYHLMVERLPLQKVGMGPFNILVACDTMLQVAQGMEYIHDKGVVHRDLKSHNILVRRSKDDESEYICVKVGDFGISKTKERSFLCTHQTSNTGPDRSMAPELIQLPRENKEAQSSFHPYKSDVYGFGMLCFEILTGEMPFATTNNTREVKKKILAGIRPVLPLQCPPELKRLIESCWDSVPTNRPYFPEICEKLRGLNFSLLIEERVQTMASAQTLRGTHSTNPPQWYLNCARQCMESVQLMTSRGKNVLTKVKIHHHQCQYLADELKVAVEVSCQVLGSLLSARTQTHTRTKLSITSSSFEHKTEFVDQLEILMLLWQCATEIESFMKDCCTTDWLKIAVTSRSVVQSPSVSVASWGYHLKLCVVLLHNTLGATSLAMTELESMKEAELLVVNEKASVDDATLFNTLSLILSSNSNRTNEFQLATILCKRLEVGQSMLVTIGPLEAPHEHFKIDSRALEMRAKIGAGSVGVYRCTWYGANIAIKVFHIDEDRVRREFMTEVSIFGSLRHPNIVCMLGYSMHEKECIIMMELMLMSLDSLMEKRLQNLPNGSPPFNIHVVVDLMLQVAEGMNYLHQFRIVHRDLKSGNILVGCVKATNLMNNDPELLKVKVADFGVSARKLRSVTVSFQTTNVGTVRWMAPEVMRNSFNYWDKDENTKYPYKSDIYSFGMLCYEILTGDVPFPTLDGYQKVRNAILNGDRPMLPQQCPRALKTLIEACWHPNPTSRPSSTQICQTLRYLKYTSLLPDNKGGHQAQPVPETQHIAKVFDFSRLLIAKIQNSCLHRGIQLGKGGQETIVYEAIHHHNKVACNRVAQKRFVPAYNEDFKEEITILSYLKHPNIVSLVGYAVDNRSCSIIMELMDGDLHDMMCRNMRRTAPGGPFSIDDAIHVMLQIAQGMDYVHQKNVVHMDLKSYNILAKETNKGKPLDVKVADFSLSKQIKPGSHLHFNVGTPSWMAPEVMRLKCMSSRRTSKFFYFSNARGNIPLMSQKRVEKFPNPFKSDIYSFGIVCFEILSGNSPTFHLKSGTGHEVQIDPQKTAMFMVFLFLEGLMKLNEDHERIGIVVLVLLKGLNFKKDPHRAIIILTIFHLKFKKRDQIEVLKEKVLVGYRPILPDYCPPKLKALIESCWAKDASTRPTFAQIIMGLKGVHSRGHLV